MEVKCGQASLERVQPAKPLKPPRDLAAVAGPTSGRGCRNLFSHDAQPRVTAITRTGAGTASDRHLS